MFAGLFHPVSMSGKGRAKITIFYPEFVRLRVACLNFPLAGVNRFHPDLHGPRREYTPCSFRPFHQTDITRIKTVFHPRPDGLILIFNTVKIDVVNRSAGISIFVDDGEGGTAYGVRYFFYFAKGMDKGCFSGAQLTAETEYFFRGISRPEFPRQRLNG